MSVLGWCILIIGAVCYLFILFAMLGIYWQHSPMMTIGTFVPFIGPILGLILLVRCWSEVKWFFLASIPTSLMIGAGAVMIGMGADPPPDPRLAGIDPYGRTVVAPAPASPSSRSSNPSRSYTSPSRKPAPAPPPPRPLEPIFKPNELTAGVLRASSFSDFLPPFDPPDIGLTDTKALKMQGYEIQVPKDYKIDRVTQSGDGTEWHVVGGQVGNEPAVKFKVRVIAIRQEADGQVFIPSWSEFIGQSGIDRSKYRVEYGSINDIPFARCTDEFVRSGHGTGSVRYLGMAAPTSPQRLEIEFQTDPNGYGRSYALMCEAFARSLTRGERVMMPTPKDKQAIPTMLAQSSSPASTEADPAATQLAGPIAFAIDQRSRSVSFSGWSLDGHTWKSTGRLGGADDVTIQVALHPASYIPEDRVRPVALKGPMQTDGVACAYGADAKYVRLWNDEVFARIEHHPEPRGSAQTFRKITYHGYLSQNHIDITLTTQDQSGVSLSELDHYLATSRLAYVTEIAENTGMASWLQEVLAEDQPSFYLANGVDLTQALSLDEQGSVTVSPQYDATAHRMYDVYPTIDDPEILAAYEQWTANAEAESHLSSAEKLDEIEICPLKDLRPSHRSKQMIWQTQTPAGTVGMTVHVEDLRPSDHDLKTPIAKSSSGRVQVRLGRRIIQPSQTPEITYNELRNLRVWRVKLVPNARQEIARCHYLAMLPGKMLVVSTSYHANRPEQLDAFDASVATLMYQEGAKLSAAKAE